MAQTHLEIFPSEYHMLKFFGGYLPKLDVDASARLSPFLYSYDNELVMGRNLYEFLTQIEDMTALGINTLASVQKGGAYLVFFDKTPKSPEKFLSDVGDIQAARSNVLDTSSEEGEIINQEEIIQTEVVEQPATETESSRSQEEKDALLAEAEAFRDDSKKTAAKAALESFALSVGISLSKSKNFDSMLEDFKSAL